MIEQAKLVKADFAHQTSNEYSLAKGMLQPVTTSLRTFPKSLELNSKFVRSDHKNTAHGRQSQTETNISNSQSVPLHREREKFEATSPMENWRDSNAEMIR